MPIKRFDIPSHSDTSTLNAYLLPLTDPLNRPPTVHLACDTSHPPFCVMNFCFNLIYNLCTIHVLIILQIKRVGETVSTKQSDGLILNFSKVI